MTFLFSILPFLLRHWKLAVALAALGGMGIEGWHLARAWDERAALTAQAEALKHRLATITLLQQSDAKRAETDAEQIEKLKDLARETPKNDSACLDRSAVSRLRAIR